MSMQEVIQAPELQLPRARGAARQTQPFYNPSALGGFAVIARRGISDPSVISTKPALQRLACGNPMRLLAMLPELDPAVGLATWNALRLTTGPDAVRIVAMKESAKGEGDDQIDDAATAELSDLWNRLPAEIGGLNGLLETLIFTSLYTGMPCIEAVPGASMTGLAKIWPVDPLTIAFKRNPDTSEVMPLQWQFLPKGTIFQGNYVELDPLTFFWRALDAPVDEPYGRAPYAPALPQILADMALIQDLRDAVHNGAWPRTAHGFNFAESFKVATEQLKMTDPNTVAAWVNERFKEAVQAVSELKPDDNVVYDATGKLETIEGGKGFAAIEPILAFLRQRVVQSVKSLPTLMGINDGSTQTYTTVEWQIYASGLETLRDIAVQLLVKAANLHLRLRGLPYSAAAIVTKIRTSDALLDAQAEGLRIANEKEKIKMGWTSNEQSAIEITGSGPVSEPLPGAFGEPIAPAPNDTPPPESGQQPAQAA
jgi:hypothetical protein